MRAVLATLSATVVLLSAVSGCNPGVSKKDLGTVVFKVPKVPGADQPYKLPKLGAPPPETEGPFGAP
jgi:hypothetical protein